MPKRKRKKVGRPSKITPLRLKKLEEAFALGCTDREACIYAGISTTALYNYQKDNEEFLERKETLKQTPILKARQILVEGLKGNPELALKFLERKVKGEFSPRQEISGEVGTCSRCKEVENLSDEELEAEIIRLSEWDRTNGSKKA